MDRKLKIKVLEQGPDKNSQQEMDYAAWLIKKGYAEYKTKPNFMKPGTHVSNQVWGGATQKGVDYFNSSPLERTIKFLSNNAIAAGLIIAAITGIVNLVFYRGTS